MLQDLYKTELILALWYLGDQITKCVQTVKYKLTPHRFCIYKCQLCTGKRWYRKCWRCIDLHGKTKQECCTNVDVSIWVLDLCAVTEHWNNMEENMSRTKLQVTTGQAAHQHKTALDNEKKRHVSMEGKDGRGGCTGGTEAEHAYYFWGLYCHWEVTVPLRGYPVCWEKVESRSICLTCLLLLP